MKELEPNRRNVNKRRSVIWAIEVDELKRIVSESKSLREALAAIGCEAKGGNYRTLSARLKEEGIKYRRSSHRYSIHTKKKYNLPMWKNEVDQLRMYQRSYGRGVHGKSRTLVASAKSAALRHNLDFNITYDWVRERVEVGSCEMTNIEFDLQGIEGGLRHKYAPSLDRKDRNRGYTQDNVQVVVWMYNQCKSHYSDQDVEAFLMAASSNLSSGSR
jgi:hypothetical protein